MRVIAVIVNIFLPGIGTLLVGKWGQAIAQLLLGLIAWLLILTGIGVVMGTPLAFVVWIWAIVSAATPKPAPIQVVVQQGPPAGRQT